MPLLLGFCFGRRIRRVIRQFSHHNCQNADKAPHNRILPFHDSRARVQKRPSSPGSSLTPFRRYAGQLHLSFGTELFLVILSADNASCNVSGIPGPWLTSSEQTHYSTHLSIAEIA